MTINGGKTKAGGYEVSVDGVTGSGRVMADGSITIRTTTGDTTLRLRFTRRDAALAAAGLAAALARAEEQEPRPSGTASSTE